MNRCPNCAKPIKRMRLLGNPEDARYYEEIHLGAEDPTPVDLHKDTLVVPYACEPARRGDIIVLRDREGPYLVPHAPRCPATGGRR